MAKSYSTFTQTTKSHLGLFQAASSFQRTEFHMPCSWIYQEGETCYSVNKGPSSRTSADLTIAWYEVLAFT